MDVVGCVLFVELCVLYGFVVSGCWDDGVYFDFDGFGRVVGVVVGIGCGGGLYYFWCVFVFGVGMVVCFGVG